MSRSGLLCTLCAFLQLIALCGTITPLVVVPKPVVAFTCGHSWSLKHFDKVIRPKYQSAVNDNFGPRSATSMVFSSKFRKIRDAVVSSSCPSCVTKALIRMKEQDE